MDNKIMIISNSSTNLLDSILYLMEQEKLDYCISDNIDDITEDITAVIYIDQKNELYDRLSLLSVPVVVVSDYKKVLQNTNSIVNYVITELINDNMQYTDVQKEFLFKKGLYSVLNTKIIEFINSEDNINGLVIDMTECEVAPSDWVFKFNSIAETYSWISNKNKSGDKSFVKKEINFYDDKKVYNDSSKEINYLIDKIMDIKNGINLIDIYVCTNEELEKFKSNYFFKSLLNNLSETYKMYFIDKEILSVNEPELLEKFLDGIIIYDDCIYRDTYDDEYSLGYVDCNSDVICEYNKLFDYVFEKYSKKLNSDGDVDGI